MFCIAAFIVLAIISIFSASHRKLAKKAWNCTLRRVTFRPCDTSFKEEAKSKLLSRVANKTPKLVKTADIGIEIASFALVIFTIWSLLVVMESGLNLFVWGTCNPNNASSCSLTAETCSIDKTQKSFWELTSEGKPFDWFVNQAETLGNTIANIPTRLQSWNANDYLPQNVTYYYAKDSAKPVALEIIDPGCRVCMQLFGNIKSAKFEDKYNLAYIAYPIKNSYEEGKYKFPNSYTVTRYLEALKINPLGGQKVSTDWQILEKIFTGEDSKGVAYQVKINTQLNQTQTEELIRGWLSDIGYSPDQIKQIDTDAGSQKVADVIKQNQQIVNNRVKTVKIPTIIFNGQRHDGLVRASDLHP
ncbi:MAG: hypothetical protein WCJ36_01960 [Candidatus Saccharibacteria bacterium]